MSRPEVLRLLEKNLRCAESLTGAEPLLAVPNWDSMAILGFMVLVDRKLGVRLKGNQVMACQTVADLIDLVCAAPVRAA